MISPSSSRCPLCSATASHLRSVGRFPLLRCPRCQLEYLSPQPDDAELAAIYGRAYYDAWGIDAAEEAVRQLKMDTFRARWRLVSGRLPGGAAVLDVGCATGYFMEVVREAGGSPYGVELSEFGADTCRKKFGPDFVYQGELENARFDGMPPEGFDAIFMSDLLEHVRDPLRTLKSARQFLRKEGLLVITAPDTASLSHAVMRGRWPHYKVEHLFHFNSKNLEQMLGHAGFNRLASHSVVKTLSARYLINQYHRFGRLPWLAQVAGALLPTAALDRLVCVRTGEMTLVAIPKTDL